MHPKNTSTGIYNELWHGEPAIRMCAGGYEAWILPQVGANVISLRQWELGADILRTPDNVVSFKARPHVYGIPVLFPPNRIAGGAFTAGGREYRFPLNDSTGKNHTHGFLRNRPWTVESTQVYEEEQVEVVLSFENSPATDFYENYPHAFRCLLTYTLSARGLEQRFWVHNGSSESMPFAVGYHTAFRIPFMQQGKTENCRVIASFGDEWELTSDTLPTGRALALQGEDLLYRSEGVPAAAYALLAHYKAHPIATEKSSFNGCILRDTGLGREVVYEVGEGYTHWMIWNDGGGKGFVCVEPQTWMVNAPHVPLPDAEKGMQLLAPGAVWEEMARIFIR